MANITQRFIDTLNIHASGAQAATDLDEAGKAHVEIDKDHGTRILAVVTDHQAGKTTDDQFKQQLLDILAHEDFAPHETMSKTMVRNILMHDFGMAFEDVHPQQQFTPTPTV